MSEYDELDERIEDVTGGGDPVEVAHDTDPDAVPDSAGDIVHDEVDEAGEVHEPEIDDSDESDADDEAVTRERRRVGFYVSPKQAFLMLAGALATVLGVLLLYLYWITAPADYTREGGQTQAGLEPIVAVYGPGTGKTPKFDTPMGVAYSKDGTRIYVADTGNNRIVVLDEDGEFVDEFGSFGVAKPVNGAPATWNEGELSYPTDVAVDENGHVYVADFYNDSISVFSSTGAFLRRFPDPYRVAGKGGSGANGGGIAVTAVAVHDGLVYATDAYQVFVFTAEGKFVRQFGRPGMDPAGLDHPGGLTVDTSGRIYVSDSNHNRVTAFSAEGKPIWVSGRPVDELQKETENTFVLPRGIALMKNGSLLVADPLNQSIVHIDEDGKRIAVYGSRGTEEGQLNFPNDVAVHGDRIVLADKENDRIQIVRLRK